MKNLNKFTKAELINKYKNLENKNFNNKQTIIQLLLNFKSLILKLTLITLIIRWIKKYSLVKKLWHIFNLIASTLLGFSLIDIYAWDVISWIKDTQIYKWISNLIYKDENIPEINESSKSRSFRSNNKSIEGTNPRTWGNSEGNIIKTQEKIEENVEYNDTPVYIIISLIIIAGITYIYFDEIKTGYTALIDWWNSRGSAPGDGSNTPTQETISTASNQQTTSSGSFKQIISKPFKRYFKIIDDESIEITKSEAVEEAKLGTQVEVKINQPIEVIDNTQPIASSSTSSNLDKGKGVLTSPSLEDLNEKAKDSWSETSSNLSSSSSTETITPSNYTAGYKFWKLILNNDEKEKVNFIENSIKSGLNNKNETIDKLRKELAQLIAVYDTRIEILNICEENEKNLLKHNLFELRKWIKEHFEILFPDEENVNISIGLPYDEPTTLANQIWKD